MTIGYIGLGKMGYNMVLRLLENDHNVVVYNRNPDKVKEAEAEGAVAASSIEELVSKLQPPRLVWIMVSHQAVDEVLNEVYKYAERGDVIVDGGNSPYLESIRRSKEVEEKGFTFVDAGVSGGPGGARNGACIMVGGDVEAYNTLEPVLQDLAVKDGYGHFGSSGSGHFVKMVHNGIEYGMMQAIAEGFDIMKNSSFDLDLKKIAKIYNHQSVIESRLVGWLSDGFEDHGVDLKEISGSASASGEGKWTVEEAERLGIPTPIIGGSLKVREESQKKPSYQGKIISALRNQFGKHEVSES
jgi:6-phosphogluconate dehydrogenase